MTHSQLLRLDEVCDKITDGTHHSPANGPDGEFKYITAKNIKPWGLDLEDVTYVDEKTHREIYSRCDVKKNDILYVKDGATTGRVAVNNLDEEFSLLSSVGVLRPGKDVRAKYLLYALQSPSIRDEMLSRVSGVAITRLTLKKLKETQVPLAPLERQDEIVAEIEKQFSRLDEGVANLQRIKANLKRYKAAVLKAAVEGRLVETEASLARSEGRSIESGDQLLKRILEARRSQSSRRGKYKEPLAHNSSDLPLVPEGWAWCSVDAVCAETLLGLDRGRDQQSAEPVGAAYIKMNNVTMDGDVLTDELVYVDASEEERARFHLASGDLLFNTRNSVELVGKVGIVRAIPAGSVFNNNLMRMRTPEGVSSVFLGYQMCSPGFRQRMEEIKKATTSVAAVYQKDMLPLAVALPPIAEQHRIVAEVDRRLSILGAVEAEVDANLKRAVSLREAILAKAFAPNQSV
ncbi:MAG: hypothetical protein RJA98_1312 [Pseudomonadota bacterium]